MKSCAICTTLVASGSMEPLGRNDALVFVCAPCNDDRPVEKQGPQVERDIDDGPRFSLPAIRGAADRATRRMGGHTGRIDGALAIKRTPGWILVRVHKRNAALQDGAVLDQQEAWQSLQRNPWGRELRYLGAEGPWFLFERPGAVDSRPSAAEALAGIEQYRRSDEP